MRSVTLTVYGLPQPKGSARAFLPKGSTRPIVTSDNPSLKKWETSVRQEANVAIKAGGEFALMTGAVEINLDFHLPRPASVSLKKRPHPTTRPDLSKLIRATEDPLIGIVFRDDAQIITIAARKRYTDGPAKAVITVIETL